MDLLTGIFSAFGLSASAGLNAYIPLLMIALLARFTNLFTLASPWDTLTNGWVIGALVVLSVVEFFADKFPAVNHVNDLIQTLVRPVAGAIAFAASAQVLTDVNPALSLVAGLLVAGGVHTVKSVAVRPTVTATTAGAGNIPISILEDVLATVFSFFAVLIPVLFGIILLVISVWVIWYFSRRARKARRQT